MTKNRILFSLPLCIMIALLAAFLIVSPAFAQDETPPGVAPTDVPAEVLTTEAAPAQAAPVEVATEVAPAEAPVEVTPTEAAPAEETQAEAAPTVDPQEEVTPVAEPSLAEQLDDAGLVLGDSSGAPVSLATRSSGMLITEGDPYFTVGSVTYQFINWPTSESCGLNCWHSPTPISDAVQYMIDNNLTPTDRLLHIEAGTYNDVIDIYGTDNGVKGLIGIKGEAAAENVIINGWVYIANFAAGFSLSNLTVNDINTDDAAIWFENNKGTINLTDVNATDSETDGLGILIDHNGIVQMTRVNSSNNGYIGARVRNTGAVTISNSTFDGNLQDVDMVLITVGTIKHMTNMATRPGKQPIIIV
jgi:hypothetical protein